MGLATPKGTGGTAPALRCWDGPYRFLNADAERYIAGGGLEADKCFLDYLRRPVGSWRETPRDDVALGGDASAGDCEPRQCRSRSPIGYRGWGSNNTPPHFMI